MKRSVLITLLASLAVAATVAGFFLAQPNALAPRVAQLELELGKAKEEITRLKAEREKLIATSKAGIKPVITSAATGTDAATTQAAGASTDAKTPMAEAGNSMRKMMEMPGMKDMMRKQHEVQIDMTYAKLFQQLGLNDQERENFKRLLGDRLVKQYEIGMKMMDANLTADQRKVITTDLDKSKKESDAAIKQFLNNDEDFKTYQHWDETQPERMQLQLGESSFAAAGAPLSDEQREQLVNVMAGIRKSPSAVPDLNDPRVVSPTSLSPENIARQLQRYDTDAQRVLAAAAAFLTPEQVEALKKMQQQMRTMTEAGMKMSGAMFGAGKK